MNFLSKFLLKFIFIISLLNLLPLQTQGVSEQFKKVEIQKNFNLAINFFNRKSYNIATLYFMDTLKKDPQHFLARYFLSQSFYKAGRNQEAIRELENLIRLHGINRFLEKRINFYNRQRFLNQKKYYQEYIWIRDYPIQELSSIRSFNYDIQTPIHLWINPNNELIVLDFSLKSFFKLGGEGNYLESYLGTLDYGSYYPLFSSPWAFVKVSDGYWVSDFYKDVVKKIDLFNGKEIMVIGEKGSGNNQFLGPKGLAIDENENLYITDSGNARIQFWNQRGEWLDNFGERGTKEDALLNPIDITYDRKRKQLYVLDKGNNKVLQFNKEKKFLSMLKGIELSEPQKLYLTDQDDLLYILDKDKVYQYNLNLNQVSLLKITKKTKDIPSHYASIAVGQDDYVYLGNALTKKIEVYSPTEKTYINLPVMINQVNVRKHPIVQLEVSVKDLEGHPIRFLNNNNFIVYENKNQFPFKLLPKPSFSRFNLLIEKSRFAEKKELAIKTFIGNFFDQIQARDQVKLITYNQNGHQEKTPFNHFKLATIEKALENTEGDYSPSFTINSALQTAVKKSYNPNYKNAIILLAFSPHQSEHFPNNSYSQILQLVKNNELPVYVFYAGSMEEAQSLFYLRNLAQQTGGKFYIYDERALQNFEMDFKDYHNGVYYLQYLSTSKSNKGAFQEVGVEVIYKNSQGEDKMAGYPAP